MKMFKKNSKGFTLIELLVVIAIIGILSSVVLASLNSARKKSRDARRVADIKQLQLALELYFDSNKKYPAGGFSALSSSLVPTYLPAMSNDPLGGSNTYKYCADSATAATTYNLAATLEESTNSALNSDSDVNVATCASGDTFDGTSALVYDVRP